MKPEKLIGLAIGQLAVALNNALDVACDIQREWNVNGIDSLANIDYGAELNKHLKLINETFEGLDKAGLFTAELPDDDDEPATLYDQAGNPVTI